MLPALGNIPAVVPPEQRKPLWLFPNLLSLDAPLVAVVWLHIFATTWHVSYLPWVSYAALALVVWVIYVTDRLLDASMRTGDDLLEERHRFHHRNMKTLRTLAVIAAILAIVLVTVQKVPFFGHTLRIGLPLRIYSYAPVGGLLVAGFFALSLFGDRSAGGVSHAKNVLAGFAFAYGTACIADVQLQRDFNLTLSPEFLCFSVLCILNISAIDLWEHAARHQDEEVKASDELALTLPLTLLGGASIWLALKDEALTTRPFFYAILTGAALLYILNRTRARFRPEALRVLADVALLVPILVFQASWSH